MATSTIKCGLRKTLVSPVLSNEKYHNFTFYREEKIICFTTLGLYLSDSIPPVPAYGSIVLGTLSDSDFFPKGRMIFNVSNEGKTFDVEIRTYGEIKVVDRSGQGISAGELIDFFSGTYIALN